MINLQMITAVIIGIIAVYFLFFRRSSTHYADIKGKSKTFYSRRYNLVSKPDFVRIRNDVVTVREAKSRQTRYYPSDVAQLNVELITVMDNIKAKKYVGIIELSNNEEAYRREYTRKDMERLFGYVSKHYQAVLDVRAGRLPPPLDYSSPKCRSCSKRSQCFSEN